jgi:hypothetical protein
LPPHESPPLLQGHLLISEGVAYCTIEAEKFKFKLNCHLCNLHKRKDRQMGPDKTFGRSGIIRVGEQYHVIENDKIFKCQGYHGHLMVIMKSKFKQ